MSDLPTVRLYGQITARLLPVDIILAVCATFTWFAYLEVNDVAGAVLMCAGMLVLHCALWLVPLGIWLGPLTHGGLGVGELEDEQLRAADAAAERLPAALALAYTVSFLVYFGLITLLGLLVVPDVVTMGRSEVIASSAIFAAVLFGAPVLVFPLVRTLLEDTQAELATEFARRGQRRRREPVPMAPRLALLAACLVAAPTLFYAGNAYIALAGHARRATLFEQREAVRQSARTVAARRPIDDPDHTLVSRPELPELLLGETSDESAELLDFVDVRREQVTVAAAVGDGRWVLATAPVETSAGHFWLGLLVFMLVVLVWAMVSIRGTTRALFQPLERLSDLVRRLIAEGQLIEVGRIPVLRNDEIGALTTEFNNLIDQLEELAGATAAVAEGDLQVEILGRGDLQDAFRTMLARLARLVTEIREAGVGVASAAAEIHTTTGLQEHAAAQQSEGVRGVGLATGALAESASGISTAAHEVLANAERTRAHSDEVVAKSGELNHHIAGIGELLAQIREIADRSDLLALNGSLEATRAGEAGRGFALVAAEMRRLAERVTQTVDDVRGLVTNIQASSSEVISATRDSHSLAEQTASAAERIVELTNDQRDETEQVSTNAQAIAEVVEATAITTGQTRATADGLHTRARALGRLIEHFESAQSKTDRAGLTAGVDLLAAHARGAGLGAGAIEGADLLILDG